MANLSEKLATWVEGMYARAVAVKFYGEGRNWVSDLCISGDGRKRERLTKDLLEVGFIVKRDTNKSSDDRYKLTDSVYDRIESVEPNFIEVWKEKRKGHLRGDDYNFVRLDNLKVGERKYVFDHLGDYKFAVVSESVFRYQYKLGEYNRCIEIASLEERADAAKRCGVGGLRNKTEAEPSELVVYDVELEEYAELTWFDEKVQRLFTPNLEWGLAKLELIDKEPKDTKDKNAKGPRVYATDDNTVPSFGRGTYDSLGREEEWADKIGTQIGDCSKRIVDLEAQLAYLKQLNGKVLEYGGWVKFRKEYRTILTAEVKRMEENKKDTE